MNMLTSSVSKSNEYAPSRINRSSNNTEVVLTIKCEPVWTWNIFGQKRRGAVFEFFFANLIAHGTKTRRPRVLIFGTLVELRTLYSN